ncbi:hypothetical protein HY947_04030 [Candidatus Gottesmanbacteria bacterium]|nr:hypothetical protein [Candidatus Gottesmanbacteria bacterium]
MKKKLARASAHRSVHHASTHRTSKADGNYLVVVRGWMFVVAFALMLGVGAIVGNFIASELNASTPQVAGASTSR